MSRTTTRTAPVGGAGRELPCGSAAGDPRGASRAPPSSAPGRHALTPASRTTNTPTRPSGSMVTSVARCPGYRRQSTVHRVLAERTHESRAVGRRAAFGAPSWGGAPTGVRSIATLSLGRDREASGTNGGRTVESAQSDARAGGLSRRPCVGFEDHAASAPPRRVVERASDCTPRPPPRSRTPLARRGLQTRGRSDAVYKSGRGAAARAYARVLGPRASRRASLMRPLYSIDGLLGCPEWATR